MKIWITVLTLFLTWLNAYSQTDTAFTQQRNCGSVSHNQFLENKYPELKNQSVIFEKKINDLILQKKFARVKSDTTILTIPVVVHIIHNNKSGIIGGTNNNNISNEQINSQIEVLNEDYRRKIGTMGYNSNPVGDDIKIEFKLASRDPNCYPTNGITRHYSSQYSFDMDYDNTVIKSNGYWPSDQYLNIWVCRLSGGVLGYAQFPNYTGLPGLSPYEYGPVTDGVVIHYNSFGREIGTVADVSNIYRFGRSATHEIGHWLGLKHIWGDETCGNDFCDDTPQQTQASPSNESCPVQTSKCSGLVTVNMSENYMDYSADRCMNIFTKDQNTRIQTTLNVSPNRLKLFTSKGCEKTNYLTPAILTDFETNDTLYWTKENTDSILNWAVSNQVGFNSESSLKCNNTIFKVANSYADYVSPFINFSNIDNPMLFFDVAYPDTDNKITDTLFLFYSKSCKTDSYVIFDTLTGEELITTNKVKSDFIPSNSDWKSINYNLPFLKNEKQVRIKLRSKSNNINTLYIDNINFPIINNNCYTDQNNKIYLDRLSLVDNEVATIKIYDSTGKYIISLNVTNSSTDKFAYDLSYLASGMYIATLESSVKSSKTKFVIIH